MRLVSCLGLAPGLGRTGAMRAIGNLDAARLSVELEENCNHALLVDIADGEAADHKRLAALDFDEDLVLRLHAVEIDRRRQHADRAVFLLRGGEIREDLRIHQPGRELELAHFTVELCLKLRPAGIEVGILKKRTRPHGNRLLALERLLLKSRRPAPGRLSEIAAQHRHDGIREGDVAGGVLDFGDGQVLADHHQRHVAHNLGRRCHLDDVAEHQIDVVIGLRDLVPARFQPERARLLLQVGELPAGHLVKIDLGGRALQVALERGVLVANRLPVERNPADPARIEPAVPLAALQRLDDGTETGL